MAAKFTDKYIASLKPEDGKQIDIREGGGFGVRVLPSGVKLFFYIYRIDGKRRFLNLGHYDPSAKSGERGTLAFARKLYAEAFKKVADGGDPLREEQQAEQERREAPTVAELAEEYIERHAKLKKRSWQADKRTLDVEIIPKWGDRKARDITRRHVVLLLEGVAERAPVMANRVRALLSKVFAFAIERELVEVNPVAGVKRSATEVPRERTLTEAEIAQVWRALDTPGGFAASQEVARALQIVLLTGQRPGEVIGLHSGEIDGDWWEIPAERAKNGRAHRVFLTSTAKRLIGDKQGFIFESPKGDKPIAVNAVAHAVRDSVEKPKPASEASHKASRKPEATRKLAMEPWTPHDLRRTAATFLAGLGYTDEIIDAVLSHKKRGIVATYNRHRYDREKQQALEAWERKLLTIVTGQKAGNVRSIGTARRKSA